MTILLDGNDAAYQAWLASHGYLYVVNARRSLDGVLYTPVADLEEFGDVDGLISGYNSELYYKHTERRLVLDKGHVFIRGYESETVSIVEKLQK